MHIFRCNTSNWHTDECTLFLPKCLYSDKMGDTWPPPLYNDARFLLFCCNDKLDSKNMPSSRYKTATKWCKRQAATASNPCDAVFVVTFHVHVKIDWLFLTKIFDKIWPITKVLDKKFVVNLLIKHICRQYIAIFWMRLCFMRP